jgi:hypothetical protein
MSRAAGFRFGITDSASLSLDTDGTETIQPGNRSKVTTLLSDWIAQVQPETICICDPYFSPDDLGIVKVIAQGSPGIVIRILTGEKKQMDLGLEISCDAAYQEQWSSISQQKPPLTDIVVAGLATTHECPIHERWILANGKGLRLGSSFSGLGGARLSEISYLSDTVAKSHQSLVERYLTCRVRESDGIRIRYFTFSL